jgi:hypothetical protein
MKNFISTGLSVLATVCIVAVFHSTCKPDPVAAIFPPRGTTAQRPGSDTIQGQIYVFSYPDPIRLSSGATYQPGPDTIKVWTASDKWIVIVPAYGTWHK